ncbi:hypothetical protein LINGRAHAP2_LOCUS1769, partial [Linum grandiflorum]
RIAVVPNQHITRGVSRSTRGYGWKCGVYMSVGRWLDCVWEDGVGYVGNIEVQ